MSIHFKLDRLQKLLFVGGRQIYSSRLRRPVSESINTQGELFLRQLCRASQILRLAEELVFLLSHEYLLIGCALVEDLLRLIKSIASFHSQITDYQMQIAVGLTAPLYALRKLNNALFLKQGIATSLESFTIQRVLQVVQQII